jgi:hypothetical protein
MSRTYNTPPSIFRTKAVQLGRGFGSAAKALLLSPWTALKSGFESALRASRAEHSMLDTVQPRQFFGLSSITQDLLDKAERDRRCGLPADPFEVLGERPGKAPNDERLTSRPAFTKFRAARHAER